MGSGNMFRVITTSDLETCPVAIEDVYLIIAGGVQIVLNQALLLEMLGRTHKRFASPRNVRVVVHVDDVVTALKEVERRCQRSCLTLVIDDDIVMHTKQSYSVTQKNILSLQDWL
jgi:hypothetical protein